MADAFFNTIIDILIDANVQYEILYSDGSSSYDLDFYDGAPYYTFWILSDNAKEGNIKYFPQKSEISIYNGQDDFVKNIQIGDLKAEILKETKLIKDVCVFLLANRIIYDGRWDSEGYRFYIRENGVKIIVGDDIKINGKSIDGINAILGYVE